MKRIAKIVAASSTAAVLLLCVCFLAIANHRPTAALLAVAFAGALSFPSIRRRRSAVVGLVLVWFAVAMSPLELSFYRLPGGPRIMQLAMGLFVVEEPKHELIASGFDQKHNVVYGGDVVGGLEPKWVVVW